MAVSTSFTELVEHRDIVDDTASIGRRIAMFDGVLPAEDPTLIVSSQDDKLPPTGCQVPEVPADQFSAHSLRAAIRQHGALIVRKLFPETFTDTARTAVDRVLEAADKFGKDPEYARGGSDYYFSPPGILSAVMPGKELGNSRGFHRDSGSAMCVEAPCVAEALLNLYEEYGLKNKIADYLGETPCLSAKKWVLRRSRLPISDAGWHQDGAFMGTDINSINMWLPLSRCGGTCGAPGMDVIPRRLTSIVSAQGAQFNWSVSPGYIEDHFGDSPPVSPVFNPGDAFFFDHYYLHRTQYGEAFEKQRYAIETWFFGDSSFPKNQVPIAW